MGSSVFLPPPEANPFDQDLNSFDNVQFDDLTLSGGFTLPMSSPSNLVSVVGTSGALAAGTYLIKVSAVDPFGNHTNVSNEVSSTITVPNDGVGSCLLTWTGETNALYRVWVSTDAGVSWVFININIPQLKLGSLDVAVSGSTPPSTNTASFINTPTETMPVNWNGKVLSLPFGLNNSVTELGGIPAQPSYQTYGVSIGDNLLPDSLTGSPTVTAIFQFGCRNWFEGGGAYTVMVGQSNYITNTGLDNGTYGYGNSILGDTGSNQCFGTDNSITNTSGGGPASHAYGRGCTITHDEVYLYGSGLAETDHRQTWFGDANNPVFFKAGNGDGFTFLENVVVDTGYAVSAAVIFPTSDPMIVGAWWNNAGTLTISAAV